MGDIGWQLQPGGLGLGHGWAMFRGQTGDNLPHAHHAVQLAVADGVQITLAHGPSGQILQAPGFIIGSNVSHQLLPSRDVVQLLYLDPAHRWGQMLQTLAGPDVFTLTVKTARALGRAMAAEREAPPWSALARELRLNPEQVPTPHPAVHRVLTTLDQHLDAPVRLQKLANEMHCSASHAARLFRTHVGLPVRPYLRWRRLILAVRAVAQGADLTRAAAEAGFSDSAHLSRTVRQAFGIEARTLLKFGLHQPGAD